MKRCFAALLALFAALLARPAVAHEVRPGYLEIRQTADALYVVTWKQPTMGEVAIHLDPHLSNGWLDRKPDDQYAAPGYLIRTWRIRNDDRAPLAGQSIAIDGLKDTMTDVYVRISLRNDQSADAILRPENAVYDIDLKNGAGMALGAFVLLGIEHILSGPDHLLFVFGLILLVRNRWSLLKTVTAFTLAHSITLALASLGLIGAPPALLDALIALSILFLAPEIIRAQRGETSLTIRHPWAVAFIFGLLHGMGFATGLKSLGLTPAELPGPLLSFNVGVEIGQLGFIGLVLAVRWAFAAMRVRWPRPLIAAPTYVIGVAGAAWTFQCAAQAFGLIA